MTHTPTSSTPHLAGLDPDVRHFMVRITEAAAQYPSLDALPIAEARQVAEAVRQEWTRGGPGMAAIEAWEAPGRDGPVRLRVYRPKGEAPMPALIYLHGGGWTLFSLDTHDRLMREYAARAGMIVIGVDYALSPEAKYPTALNQVIDVLRWLPGQADALGMDPHRIAVGGDSAGANLSLSAAISLRDAGQSQLIQALILNYGAFDATLSKDAIERFGQPGHMLEAVEMQGYWQNYVRHDEDLNDPLVCPLRADLTGLPACFMVIAERDVLSEQNLTMSRRLRQSGVPVQARVYSGTVHSFLEAVAIAEVSNQALNDTAQWLRYTLENTVA